MKKIFFGLLIGIFFVIEASAQSFNATVNRNSLPEGETFVLTLDLKDVDTTVSPDLNSLSENFTTFSISNGYRTNIINGDVSKSRQWNLVLMPNTTGELIIPAIELAGYKTKPITINVLPAGSEHQLVQAKPENSPKFKIKGTIDNNSPYVQQQLNYQLKIYDAGGLQGEAPSFITSNNDWIIKSLGAPNVETKIVNGQTLREITFNYALFAQKSGELTIPPVRFNGYYLTRNTRTDPFARFFDEDDFFTGFGMHDIFAAKTPIVLNTQPITVNVKPADVQSGWWMPASDVKLSAEFDSKKPEFKVGEAVSRTIYLKAVGVLDNQLPEIKFTPVNGVKQYPEKPVVEMVVENNKVVSLARISNVYIPEKEGEFVLPKIQVNWFNVSNNSFETAVIPEYRTYVQAGVKIAETQQQFQNSTKSADVVKEITTDNTSDKQNINNLNIIGLVSIAFVGGIILTLLLIKIAKLTDKTKTNNRKAIIDAAKSKNLHQLRDALIVWTADHFPHHKVTNLQDVADIFKSVTLNKELDKIRETLYAEDEKSWDENNFLEVFNKVSKQIKKHKRTINEPLPKLYK